MTEAEIAKFREIFPGMLEGYRYMEIERLQGLKSVNTKEAMSCLSEAFQLASKLPMRESSGLVEYYRVLSRPKR